MTLLAQDAADYDFPRQAAVVYMLNPFGEKTMRRVIGNLEQSLTRLPRSLYLIYYNPVHHRVIDDSRLLLPVAVDKRYRVYQFTPSASAQPGPTGT